jgi:hypothetical protein
MWKKIYLELFIKNFKLNLSLQVKFYLSFPRNFEESLKIPFENMVDSFQQIRDSESTPESYDSFYLEQNNRRRTNSKFRDSC